jgi:hypothetical protein
MRMKKLLVGVAPTGAAAASAGRRHQSLSEVDLVVESSAAHVAAELPWPPPELELGAPPRLPEPESVALVPAFHAAEPESRELVPAPQALTPELAAVVRPREDDILKKVKRTMLVLLAMGVAAFFAGQGTFASFSAETSNNGSSIASGTLSLTNTVNSAGACLTTSALTQNNLNAGCAAALTLTNVAPGVFGGAAQIAVQNTGSIDASKLYVYASPVNSTLSAQITSGATTTSLPIVALEGNVSTGDSIIVSFGTHSQTFTATSAASGGATSISVTSTAANFTYPISSSVTDSSSDTNSGTPTLTTGLTSGVAVTSLALGFLPGNVTSGDLITVTNGAHTQTFAASSSPTGTASPTTISVTSQLANFSYPIGSTVADISANATNANIDCYDAKTTVGGTTGSTKGTDLNFNPVWGNPLCGTLLLSIQEINAMSLSSALSTGSPITLLPIASLGAAVGSGDSIVVASGNHTQTFTTTAAAAIGATSLAVSSVTPTFAFPTTSSVTDVSSGNKCWIGKASVTLSGACVMPISVNLNTALSTGGGAITSLPVTALNGNVVSGDTIQVTSGTNTQTFTSTASAFVGATSIAVTSVTPNFNYPTTSTVTDVSANASLSILNSDVTDTITNFDTTKGVTFRQELAPVTANGTSTAAPVELTHGTTRTFEVGVYFPSPIGTQNQLQGLASTFGITWHIDQ